MPPTTRSPTRPDVEPASTLWRLLDAELDFDTDAHHGFTSHLAMGLVAAARLGAEADVLERWFEDEAADGYLRRRPGRPDWLPAITARVERRGIDAEVRTVLPDLVDRVGGFFHWMIRLELAIDAGHPGQVANALGDWQRRPRRTAASVAPAGSGSVADVIDRVIGSGLGPGSAGGISGDRSGPATAAVAEVADHPDLLAEIAEVVADLHWAVDDFTTLHLVTGTRAARALEPFLAEPDRRRLAHAHLHAVAEAMAGHVPSASAAVEAMPERAMLPDWRRIGADAIETGDDHVVKLVYAAELEEAATGRPVYRAIAARAAGVL